MKPAYIYNQQLDSIKKQMNAMSNEELSAIIDHAKKVVDTRKDQRKRELWGNVTAAIAKYEREIEPISFHCPGDDCCSIDKLGPAGNITVS